MVWAGHAARAASPERLPEPRERGEQTMKRQPSPRLAPAAQLLCALSLCTVPAVQAQVLNPNVCPGGTLYGSRDDGAYSGFSSAPNVVQADCHSNIAGGAESQAGIDLSTGNIAIGRLTTAYGGNASAYGIRAQAGANGASAMGLSSNASANSATAIGSFTEASAGSALAMGNVAKASGESSVAMGYRSAASAVEAVSIGADSAASGERAVAVGSDSQASGVRASALGVNSKARAERSLAVGSDSDASGYGSAALGSAARASGDGAMALGYASFANADAALAMGRNAWASGLRSMALGALSTASGENSVAIGAQSSDGGRGNVVSFGSAANQRTLTNVADVEASGQVSAGTLSVGGGAVVGGQLVTQGGIDNRGAGIVNAGRISGVVAGNVSATSNDAVNGAQLYGVRTTAEQALTLATNQGAQVIDMTQQLQTHTAQIHEQSVQLQAVVNGQLGVCTVNGGALRCSVAGQAPASASGMGAVAVGIGASAQGDGAQAIGRDAQALHAGSLAIGDGARALADPTTAIGAASLASGVNAVALGANARAVAPDSVALGQGSVADRPSTVSVGSAAAPRQIVNVAPGTLPTDAVNLAQLERTSAQFGAQLQAVRDFAARGVAQAMAMPSVPMLQAGRRWFGAAAAHYAGQSAVGVGFAYQLDDHWQMGGGLSVAAGSGAQVGARVQAGYQW
jgi:hypothetical protein